MHTSRALLFPVLFIIAACSDGVSPRTTEDTATDTVSTSARWNQRAVALVVTRQPATNGQAVVSRILAYLSVAQYRAVIAARAAASQPNAPSISAAVSGASAAVLKSFFPLDSASIDGQLQTDLAAPPVSGKDIAAGTSLGGATGAAVVAQVATDNYFVTAPPAIPTGPDKWVSSPAAVVRSLYGTRPFFLTSPSQFRAPTPPAVGSAQFLTGLTEVRQISDTRTAAQTAIAVKWASTSGPFTAGILNLLADSLIGVNKVGELESARILAFANAAMFDAQIACWDSKFTYWYPRPVQRDPAITLPIAMPNHPSYPSGHSCVCSSFMGVLGNALPQQKAALDAMVDEAGMSRVYAGIHYRFDVDAGREIGHAVAALALTSSLK